MIKKITFALTALSVSISLYAAETPKDKYGMFPEPESGYVRYIVEVRKTKNDYDHKVELLIGKTMMVDCNHHSFSGKIEKLPLQGWGYSYYKVSDIKSGPTTMMACQEPKKEAFVSLRLPRDMELVRYNSRLGRVIYVPKGFEVRYRVWSAEDKVHQAKKH
ncbi:serine protease inhibitor ecotin [Sulfurovum sp. NBC37-1]|uniref:serine protease inhibitor ecotin n=1 Tax=Sulfurovum sp. (strain NBC37-1) TaxID=387093 RepID=UPI00015874D6|nr:serine protease inhibitor ecotin [Sulfurovum sp. NBC37-1]BAF71782.1 serine protease inhibitor, ecotin [Sulfurovum sp. NBC37-1]